MEKKKKSWRKKRDGGKKEKSDRRIKDRIRNSRK
jgi:hypothetical protein